MKRIKQFKLSKKKSPLDRIKLHYEETKFESGKTMGQIQPIKPNKKRDKKRKSHPVKKVRKVLKTGWRDFKQSGVDVVNKASTSVKKMKNMTKRERKTVFGPHQNVILGIGLLLVVVSIAYSSVVILIGVDGIESRIALFPQVVFALITLVKAFSKLYK